MKTVQFTVTPHIIKQRRTVKVYVYETLAEMREAAEKYDKKAGLDGGHQDTKGVTHRFERINVETNESHPNVAIIRMTRGYLSACIISHEATHAAIQIYQLDVSEVPPEADGTDDEEHFCHLVSDIVDQIVHECYKRELYDY